MDDTKEIDAVIGFVDTFIRWNSENTQPHRGYSSYHPSEWGKCLRKQQYKHFIHKGYLEIQKSSLESKQIRLFDTGHTMHERWQNKYFGNSGALKGVWECSNSFCNHFDNNGIYSVEKIQSNVRKYGEDSLTGCFKPEKCACGSSKFEYKEVSVKSPELNFFGHADLVLDFSKIQSEMFYGFGNNFSFEDLPKGIVIADMKTINDSQWKNKLMKEGPHKEYITQLTIYIHILQADFGIIFYENKNDSQLAAYRVNRNEELFNKISEQAKQMIALAENKKLPPPKPTIKSDFECFYCDLKEICHKAKIWSDPNLAENRKKFYFDV